MNAVLQQEAAADGTGGPDDRIELVDWNTAVSGVKGAIRQDGLHLTSIGQEALAGTIASALGLAPGATAPTTTTTVASDSTASRRGTSSTKTTTASSATCTTERAGSTSGGSGSGNRGSGGSGVRRLRLRWQRQDDDHGRAGARADDVTRLEPVGHGRAAHLQAGQAGLDDRTAGDEPPARPPAQPARHLPAGDEPTGHLRPAGPTACRLLERVSPSGSERSVGQWSSTQGAHSPSRSRIWIRSRFS